MSAVTNPVTVDVVDDDPDVLGSLRFLLETEGFEVRTFASGAAFLAASVDHWSDCVVIDYKMEEMNGIDLIREAIRIKPSLPAVLLTGYGRPIESKAAVGLNISEVVHKPFTMEILAGAIHGALAPRAHPRS